MQWPIRIVRITPDLRRQNELLERIAAGIERQNELLKGAEPTSNAWPAPDRKINARSDFTDEELLAAVENAEEQGFKVPSETYKRLGIAPPDQRPAEMEMLEMGEDDLIAAAREMRRPAANDEELEPPSARRDL